MKSHLQNKVYTLAAEMTHIRRKEDKWKNKARWARQKMKGLDPCPTELLPPLRYAEDNFWSLRIHRMELKPDARWTHLAWGAMRNVPYAKMEPICYGVFKGYGVRKPDWDRIQAMVAKFGGDEPNMQEIMQRFAEWLADAKVWYEGNKLRIPALIADRAADKVQKANDPVYQQAKLEAHMVAMALGKAAAKG